MKFIQGTIADGAPVVPISAQLKYNIDVVCEYIVKRIPVPQRNFLAPANMIVIRSFDVNKPGSEVDAIQGGVAGGSILQGVLKVGQEIEIRPGIVSKDAQGRIKCTPIFSRVVSLLAEQNPLQFAVPGGLIGVGTTVDPTLTRADRLVGQVLGQACTPFDEGLCCGLCPRSRLPALAPRSGYPARPTACAWSRRRAGTQVGALPCVYVELEVNFFLLRRCSSPLSASCAQRGGRDACPSADGRLLPTGGPTPTLRAQASGGAHAGGGEAGEGGKAGEGGGAHAQHRVDVHRRARAGGEERPGEAAAHQPGVHKRGGESRAQPPCGEALAAHRLGADPDRDSPGLIAPAL